MRSVFKPGNAREAFNANLSCKRREEEEEEEE
jgi:hypothetical protein